MRWRKISHGQPAIKRLPVTVTVQIRPATPNDIPAILELVAQYWEFEQIDGFDGDRVGKALKRLLESPRLGAGWLAENEGEAAGYLLAVYVFSLEHRGMTAEIDEFFVVPAQRGNGVGVRLLRAAEAEFIRAGCSNVSLQLSRGNESARTFYHRQGYGERSGFELLDKSLLIGDPER